MLSWLDFILIVIFKHLKASTLHGNPKALPGDCEVHFKSLKIIPVLNPLSNLRSAIIHLFLVFFLFFSYLQAVKYIYLYFQVLLVYPPDKEPPIKFKDLHSFCFPGGIEVLYSVSSFPWLLFKLKLV